MQISILTQLLTRLHANTLLPPEIPHTIPKNIVTIGHDIGSRIAHAVIAASPSLVDAVISTGLSYRAGIPNSFGLGFASWGGKIASTVDEKWGQRGYDTGWLDQDDELAIWTIFYREPFYDARLVHHMNTLRYPQAIMESSTAPLLNLNTSGFTKPVLFLIGEYDYIQCGGYCPGIAEPAARQAFPHSRGFESHVQRGAAHMLNLAYNATGGYQIIVDFLHKNGF
ncbi:hypothetical protein MFRU_002g01760 [Monilinia fructicola]|nr:hypothetical protein MFRU_002g01760 [Monilinia fructicola]